MARRSSSEDMKLKNMVQLVSLIIYNRGINRKKISDMTGLSNQTVTNLAKELIETGLVNEFELDRKGQGRPPIGLEFNYSGRLIVSVQITYNHIRFFLNDLSGRVLNQSEMGLSYGCDMASDLLSGVSDVIEGTPAGRIVAIVIAAEGVIDEFKSRLTFIKSLGVKNLDVREVLRSIPIPVFLVNDVNLINFNMRDRDPDMQNFMTIKYESGIGASTAINRHISRSGEFNMPGKFSHIKIEGTDEHNHCWCGGENCLGTFFAKDGLELHFSEPYHDVLKKLSDGRLPEWREFMIDKFSIILGAYVTLIGLERIFFCGRSADILGKEFFDELDARVSRKLPQWVSYKGIKLVDIDPVPVLCSRFLIHFMIGDIFEFMDVRDGIISGFADKDN